jgi:hypothetical protein
MQRARNIIRWVFLLLALAYVAWVAPELIGNFRHWRAAIPGDPLAAAFWRSAFRLDATNVLAVLVIGIVTWWGLRPRKSVAASDAQR